MSELNTLNADPKLLMEIYKAKGMDVNSAYNQYVKDKSMKHELDMKEFAKRYKDAKPNWALAEHDAIKRYKIDISELTHILKESLSNEKRIKLTEDGDGYIRWIDEYGNKGSTPKKIIEYLKESD